MANVIETANAAAVAGAASTRGVFMKASAGFVVVLVLVLSGCGGGGSTSSGSCTVASSCRSNDGSGCVESGVASSQIQQACESGGDATYSTNACSRTGSVGGCRRGSGVACTTTWFYSSAGATAEQVMGICSQTSATYVAP